MPTVYNTTQIVEQDKGFSKSSIIQLLDHFKLDCCSLLEDAESNWQNVSKELDLLITVFDEKKEQKEVAELLEQIMQVKNSIDNNAMKEWSCYDRALAIFAQGKIRDVYAFLEEMQHQFMSPLSKSDYTPGEVLDLLRFVKQFKLKWNSNVCYFNESLEKLYQIMLEQFPKEIQEICAEISIKSLTEQQADAQRLCALFDIYLAKIHECCQKAIPFGIDFEGRSKGFIPMGSFDSQNALLDFYKNDVVLSAWISSYAEENNNYLQEFNDLYALFLQYAAEVTKIDATESAFVTRVRYFKQILDRACYFNGGFCVGGVRGWDEELVNVLPLVSKPFQPVCYQDMHDFTVTEKLYLLQKNQNNFNDYNENDNHFVFHCDTLNIDENDSFELLVNKMVLSINKIGLTYLERNGYSPVIKVCFRGENETGHAVGFKLLQKDGIVYYQFRDLNFGEFVIIGGDALLKWLAIFFSKTPYPTWYNECMIYVLPHKNEHHLPLITSYYNRIQGSANGDFLDNEVVRTAYLQHQDDRLRKRLYNTFSKVEESPGESIVFYENALQAYESIVNKNVEDHLEASSILCILLEEYQNTNVELALQYGDRCLALCSSIGHEVNPSQNIKRLVYSGMSNIIKAMLLKQGNGAIDDESFLFLESGLNEIHQILLDKKKEQHAVEVANLLEEIKTCTLKLEYDAAYQKFINFFNDSDFSDCIRDLYIEVSKEVSNHVRHS